RQECLKHRGRRLLNLQEQGVVRVASLQQDDECLGADAADTDDFAGHVHDLEALQQVALVVPQGGPVGAELVTYQLVDLVGGNTGRGGQVAGRDDDRRLADDLVPPVRQLTQLR